MPPARRILGSISIALFLAALGFLASGGTERARARAAEGWPVVEGTVIDCAVTGHRAGGGGRRGRHGTTWGLELLVRYDVGGVTLVTDRESFAPVRGSDEAWCRTRARELAPGTRVEVRHDPDEPGFAVLRAEGSWIMFLPAGVFLLLAVVCALMARFARPMPPLGVVADLAPRGLKIVAIAFLAIGSLVVTAVGGFGAAVGIGRLGRLSEAAAWPEREATVVRSEWTFPTRGSRVDAKPEFAWRHEIDGIPHESGAISPVPMPEANPREWNRRILAHRPGDRITVRVDPADPARSALGVPSRTGELIPLAVAVAFVAIGLAGSVGVIRLARAVRATTAA